MNPEALSIGAASASAYLLAVVWFLKRQISSYDEAKKQTYDNTRAIMVMQTEILQLKKTNDTTDDSFKELNEKLDAMLKLINEIQITCAGRNGSFLLQSHKEHK